jgi:hypothetical protein
LVLKLLYGVSVKRLLPFGVLVCLLAFAGSASALSYRPAGVTTADSPVAAATALVEQRPALVDGADAEELVVADQTRGVAGTTIVRFDQELNGVPVLGGEVIVTVDARRRVVTADGEVLDGASPAMGPSISAAQARQLALAALGKTFGDGLLAGDPSLVIYDARIIGGPGPQEPVLVWDLADRATTAHEVARRGLRPLYPDAPPVHRLERRGP